MKTLNEKPPWGVAEYQKFIYRYLPELAKIETDVDRTCAFILKWNKMIEENTFGRNCIHWVVECVPNNHLFDFLEIQPQKDFYNNQTSNSIGDRFRPQFELNEISDETIRNEFKVFVEKYNKIKNEIESKKLKYF
jgi:hypothetical protein